MHSPVNRRAPHAVAMLSTLAALAAACGPSVAEVKRARSVSYQTDFANVWNVVSEEVRSEFHNIKLEDAVHGKLETDWKLIERLETGSEGTSKMQSSSTASSVQSGNFMRV